MKVSHSFAAGSAVFDDEHLVSCAGLVPVMTLAEQTGLLRLLDKKVCISAPRIKSGSANPAPKLATVVAGMCAGDDVDVLRSGGMKTCSTACMHPRRWERCCGSSPSGMPANSSRCCAITWWHYAGGSSRCPAPTSGCSSTSIRCCARSMGTPSKALPTGTPRSPVSRSFARALAAGHHDQDRGYVQGSPARSNSCWSRGRRRVWRNWATSVVRGLCR